MQFLEVNTKEPRYLATKNSNEISIENVMKMWSAKGHIHINDAKINKYLKLDSDCTLNTERVINNVYITPIEQTI